VKILKRSLIIFILVLCIEFLFIKAYKVNVKWDLLKKISKELMDNYVRKLDESELLNNAISGMLKNLDPYTNFYDPEETVLLESLIKGEYGGIGLTVDKRNGKIVVIAPMENSPAFRAGIQPGDFIVKVNGIDVENEKITRVVSLVRGKPGKNVKITIQRGQNSKNLIEFNLKTEIIKVKDIPFFGILDEDIGYIKISHFSKNAAGEFKKSLYSLIKKDLRGLIVDLRGNPGGLLNSAVRISDFLLPRGRIIVFTRGKKKKYNVKYYSKEKPLLDDIPLVIIVDSGSASASEIVAGAIQDNDRGVVIGTKTFGKGLVQTIFYPEKKMAFKITTSEYFTPSGRSIHKYNNKLNISDSDTFFTHNNRIIISGGGIVPDILCDEDTTVKNIVSLMKKESIFLKFATKYFSKDSLIIRHIPPEKELLDNFYSFLELEKFKIPVEGIKEIEYIKTLLTDNKYEAFLDSVKSYIYLKNKSKLYRIKGSLYKHLKKTIIEINIGENNTYKHIINDDPIVKIALEVVKDKFKYYSILNPEK